MNIFHHLHRVILRAPLYPQGFRPDFHQPGSAFRIGLRAASPEFFGVLESRTDGKSGAKIQRSLLRYQLRATSRCTPFGTFAGLAVLNATDSEQTGVTIAAPDAHHIHAQIDAARMAGLYRKTLQGNPEVLFCPNNSLYRVGRSFRYALQVDAGTGPDYDLSALEAEPYLSQILASASGGMTFEALQELVVRLADVPEDEAIGFLRHLVSEDILLPDIDPPLTGNMQLETLRSNMSTDDERRIDLERLAQLLDKPGFAESHLDEFANVMDELIPGRDLSEPDLQLDTYLHCEHATFSMQRLDEITAEFEALLPLAMPYHLPAFEQFKAQFAKRYESAAVPLLEALDPDHGISYGDVSTAWVGALVGNLPVTAPAPASPATFVRAANTMPVPVPLVELAKPKPVPNPDTMPNPASPDTMPGPVAPVVVPDTMPGPITPVIVPDTMPGPVAPVRSPDTMPQDSVHFFHAEKPSPDTMPAPPRPHVPDTMPGPVVVPDTMPGGPVIAPKPDTMPMPVEPVVIPDTMPVPQGLARHAYSPGTAPGMSLQQLVQHKYLESIREGAHEIVLTDADLSSLNSAANSRFAKTSILMGSMQHRGDDWRFAIDYAGGSTALSLLGRFANGDAALKSLAGEIAGIEAASEPDAIVAEIVHQPTPQLGNVSRRPVMRAAEIPLLSKSGASPEALIQPVDLMLQIHGDELCLFSRKTGQRVIPRLSTAHNFSSGSLPVYRFLCELQFQGQSQPAVWDWGTFRNESFLPAVRYKHLLLRRRSWKIPVAALNEPAFGALRSAWGIPDEVRCGTADQQLRYDLRNPDELALLLSGLRNNPALRIENALAESDGSFLSDAAGNGFANELIIPIANAAYRPSPRRELLVSEVEVQRSFHPSLGNWHYLRLYCGHAAADEILRDGLVDCVRELLEKRIIQSWFFLRYNEGDPELRVRFRLRHHSGRAALDAALAKWLQPFSDNGSLNRVVVDTYVRELERYGADSIEDIESLFAADSQCVAGFLDGGDALPMETERFMFAACAIDALFADAGILQDERIRILEPVADAFFREHGGTLPLQQSLNAAYRENRAMIERSLSAYPDSCRQLIERRSHRNAAIFELLETRSGGRQAMLRKIPDLMHMQMNRTFRSGQRRYEMLMYHCLLRHYRSVAARQREMAQFPAPPYLA